jgi:hypothetical protein
MAFRFGRGKTIGREKWKEKVGKGKVSGFAYLIFFGTPHLFASDVF